MAKDPNSTYYDVGGIECLDVIKAKLTAEEYLGFLKGTSMRYLMRAPYKHDSQERDLEKSANYTRWAAEHSQAMASESEHRLDALSAHFKSEADVRAENDLDKQDNWDGLGERN